MNILHRNTITRIKNESNEVKVYYKLKLILLGNSGVGKTTLLSRYMDEEFIPNLPCTIYADFKIKSYKIDSSTTVELVIWDTCGQEKYKALTNQYFKDAHGVVLMYDVNNKRSFTDLNMWLEEIKKNIIKENVSIILVGNKVDLDSRNTTLEQANNYAKDNGILYCETSSKNGYNIKTVFENLIKDIIAKRKYNFKEDNEIILNSSYDIKRREDEREKEIKCC